MIQIYIFGSQFKLGDRTINTSAMYNTMNNKSKIKIILKVGRAILGLSISFHILH